MPGGIPFAVGHQNYSDIGSNTGTSLGTTLTASGSTNTKGSYAQLTASTPYDINGFLLWLDNASVAANASYLVDIAVGAGGSEIVIYSNIVYETTSVGVGGCGLYVPLQIPAGTRVAARIQSSTASATLGASITGFDGTQCEDAGFLLATTYGATTATSLGTTIDPGAVAHTKGSYTQLTASSTYDIGALQILFDLQKINGSFGVFLMDIAVGGAGSEQVVIPNIPVILGTGTGGAGGNPMGNQYPPLLKTIIPAGTRISARAQCSNTASGSRKFGLTLVGFS